MALIKSTILAQISGSINGMTFAHNKGGAYARNRSLPSNPGTDRQDQVRTAMTSLSKMWAESLTEGQRELWRLFGAASTVINRVGDPIQLSGIAAFNRVNMFRMASLGESPVLTPPELGTGSEDPIPSFLSAEFINAPPLSGGIDVTAATTGYGLIAYLSGALSPGIRYYRGPYATFIEATAGSETFTYNIPAPWEPGMYVAQKVILYNVATSLKIWEVNVDPMVLPAP